MKALQLPEILSIRLRFSSRIKHSRDSLISLRKLQANLTGKVGYMGQESCQSMSTSPRQIHRSRNSSRNSIKSWKVPALPTTSKHSKTTMQRTSSSSLTNFEKTIVKLIQLSWRGLTTTTTSPIPSTPKSNRDGTGLAFCKTTRQSSKKLMNSWSHRARLKIFNLFTEPWLILETRKLHRSGLMKIAISTISLRLQRLRQFSMMHEK